MGKAGAEVQRSRGRSLRTSTIAHCSRPTFRKQTSEMPSRMEPLEPPLRSAFFFARMLSRAPSAMRDMPRPDVWWREGEGG